MASIEIYDEVNEVLRAAIPPGVKRKAWHSELLLLALRVKRIPIKREVDADKLTRKIGVP